MVIEDYRDIQQFEHEVTPKAKRVIIVDSLGTLVKFVRMRENLAGAAGTGANGDPNRVFTLSTLNDVDIVEVYLDGVLLVETTQYTKDNLNKRVTIILNVFDSQVISIFYNV